MEFSIVHRIWNAVELRSTGHFGQHNFVLYVEVSFNLSLFIKSFSAIWIWLLFAKMSHESILFRKLDYRNMKLIWLIGQVNKAENWNILRQ